MLVLAGRLVLAAAKGTWLEVWMAMFGFDTPPSFVGSGLRASTVYVAVEYAREHGPLHNPGSVIPGQIPIPLERLHRAQHF
jgi:hypothetical protein